MKTRSLDNQMLRLARPLWVLLLAPLLLTMPAGGAAAEGAVVHCVLFYSPTCPHCHQVINETLLPLTEQYGDRLELVAINTASQQGQALYQAAIQAFGVPDRRRGVPTLIVADVVLVGAGEIPEQLPGLIDAYMEQGGVAWPAIPGLAEALSQAPSPTAVPTAAPALPGPVVEPAPATAAAPEATPPVAEAPAGADSSAGVGDLASSTAGGEQQGIFATAADRFRQDVAGNSLAVAVLLGMIGALLFAAPRLREKGEYTGRGRRLIPVMLLVGLGVSLYMTYVETTQELAVCGPVGECNTVQQSEYAHLFGVLPIGVLGVAGYGLLALFWGVGRWGNGARRWWARRLLALAAVGGTLFSIYLTFLEPFVIGATCMWCLTSAVTMTLVMLLATGAGSDFLPSLSSGSSDSATGEPAL